MDKNRFNFKRFIKSFDYAFQGIKHTLRDEQNIFVMLIMAVIALTLGIVLKISYLERLVIVLLIGTVLSLEVMNTAIEAVVDLHDGDKKSKYGKIAKDCASGAVLVASFFALIIGIMVFLPKIIELF